MRRAAAAVLALLALVLPVAAQAEDTFTFDELGRLTSATTPAGTSSYRYFEGVRAPIVAQVTNPDGSTETFDLEVAVAAYAALTSPAVATASPATPFASSLCDGTSSNRFAFNGYRYDCETGLYLTPSGRMYDPAFGRFIQQDSYLGDLARPASLHRYAFGYNNPTRYTDPTGHDPTLKADFQIDQCARNAAACQRNTVGTPEGNLVRLQGALRVAGGGFLAAAGATSAPESGGVSLVAVGVGFDQLATGIHEVITGQPQTSMVANAIEGNARVRGLSPADAKRSGAAGEALVLLGTGVATELAVPEALAKPGLVPVRQALAEGGAFTVMEDGVIPLAPTRATRFPAGIDAVEGARLTASIRRSLQIEGRNMAIAEANINGERQLVTGVSGKVSPQGTAPSPALTDRLFKWRDSGAQTRAYDSEVKILEQLGRDLPRDAQGTVSLYTERPPCASCGGSPAFQGVIEQFQQRYPGVTVNVTSGGK